MSLLARLESDLWTERTYQEIETAGAAPHPGGNPTTQSKGFWSKRRREGRDDAELLVAARVHGLRHVGYANCAAGRTATPTSSR
jgi:hypothetical protein